jgi:hypothetical protein
MKETFFHFDTDSNQGLLSLDDKAFEESAIPDKAGTTIDAQRLLYPRNEKEQSYRRCLQDIA